MSSVNANVAPVAVENRRKVQRRQATRWCFTLNNWSEDDEKVLCENWEQFVKYLVYGYETSSTGTPHLQGFMIFHRLQSLNSLQKKYGMRFHWEMTRRTNEEAANYCMKSDLYMEFGVMPASAAARGQAGAQERWNTTLSLAMQGRLTDIDADMQIRYWSSLQSISRYHLPTPESAASTTGIWLFGTPGCGKSTLVRQTWEEAYPKAQNKWWCGYGQDPRRPAHLEDFDHGGSVLGHHLKLWADKFPFLAEVKGSTMMIRPSKFIITSNYHPSMIFTEPTLLTAILRRFLIIELPHFNERPSDFNFNNLINS